MSDLARLYPDLAAAGGLAPALNAALARLGSAVRAEGFDALLASAGGGSPHWARAVAGDRQAQLTVGAERRQFSASLTQAGLGLASGWAPDLEALAAALDAALARRLGAAALCAEHRFLRPSPEAAAAEAGPAAYVERAWQQLLAEYDPRERLGSLIEAAARLPRLRALLPYTSHEALCFSRCTGYPYSDDCPRIDAIPDGSYRLTAPGGRSERVRDPAEAAARAEAALPAGCGPARHGTADD